MAMIKKDKRLYDRIMHSKKKTRSQVNYFSGLLCVFLLQKHHDVWFIVVYSVHFNIEENPLDACMTSHATLLYAGYTAG